MDEAREPASSRGKKAYHERRFLQTPEREAAVSSLLLDIERATGGLRINSSDLVRSLLRLAVEARDSLTELLRRDPGRLQRHPSTADRRGKDDLEARLAALIAEAILNGRKRD